MPQTSTRVTALGRQFAAAAKPAAYAIGFALVVFTGACSQTTPMAPTSAAPEATLSVTPEASGAGATTGATLGTMATYPTVTLQSDLTASPSSVTVAAGSQVKFVNNSGRFVTIHSYNCSEFNLLSMYSGTWRNTQPFAPAGKTCSFFAWDTNWSRKIFQGQVVVR